MKFPKEPVIVRIKADLLGDTDSAKALNTTKKPTTLQLMIRAEKTQP